MLKITILWKERCHLLVDSVGLSLPFLHTLESSRVWFDVGGCGVVAYVGVVTLSKALHVWMIFYLEAQKKS